MLLQWTRSRASSKCSGIGENATQQSQLAARGSVTSIAKDVKLRKEPDRRREIRSPQACGCPPWSTECLLGYSVESAVLMSSTASMSTCRLHKKPRPAVTLGPGEAKHWFLSLCPCHCGSSLVNRAH